MIKRMINMLLFFLIFGSTVAINSACQNRNDPDAWEHRHNAYQPPEQVMDSLGVKPGMVVAEVGAGRGRYVVHMARRVGETGKIYANDINKRSLDYLNFRCKRDNIQNVITIRGEVIDPKLPKNKIDLVYIINTYHHLDKPVELMKNITPSLKSTGRLAIIEHDPKKVSNMGGHCTPKEKLIKEANQAGFEVDAIQTFLERDNIYILKVRMKN